MNKIMCGALIFVVCAAIFLNTVSFASAQMPIFGLAQVDSSLGGFLNFLRELISPPPPPQFSYSAKGITFCNDEHSNGYSFIGNHQAGTICLEYKDSSLPTKYHYDIPNDLGCRNIACGNTNGLSDNIDKVSVGNSCFSCGTGTKEVNGECVVSVTGSGDAGNNRSLHLNNLFSRGGGGGNDEVTNCESRGGEGTVGCERNDNKCKFCYIDRLSYCAPASTFQIECGKRFQRYYVDDILYGIRIKR